MADILLLIPGFRLIKERGLRSNYQFMKRLFITLLTVTSSLQFILAQPTQAEIDKMMKQAQDIMKKYGYDSTGNKTTKGLADQQKQISDAMKNQAANNKTVTNGLMYADPSEYGNVDNWKFPPKNAALLSSLPKRVFAKPLYLPDRSMVIEIPLSEYENSLPTSKNAWLMEENIWAPVIMRSYHSVLAFSKV